MPPTGLTLVIVTHDSSVARRVQKIGQMPNGRLQVRPTTRPGSRALDGHGDQLPTDLDGGLPARHART